MKKNPILLRNIISGSVKTEKKVIGLIGTHKGAGVTHTSIMLASYLSKSKSYKVAYLEMCDEDDIKHLLYAWDDWDEPLEERQFCIYNTTYYRNVREPELIRILNEEYEYFILDFGTDFNKNKSEFLRCDLKLVIGSLTEWKRQKLFQFIENKKELPGFSNWKYLMVFGQMNDMRIASNELHIKLKSLGFEPDPFLISSKTKELFRKLIFPTY